MTIYDSACRLIGEHDLPIIPCYPMKKHPMLKEWQHHTNTTQEMLDGWFQGEPDLNIGLPFGKNSGILGIDVDGEAAAEKLQELAGDDLPDTWEFVTPGGGYRYLFAMPEGMAQAKKTTFNLPGDHSELSLMGDGTQSIMPPSIHPNGGSYRWRKNRSPWKIELAVAPDWLVELMTSPQAQPPQKSFNRNIELLNTLARSCSAFDADLKEQKDGGVSEPVWFHWTSLLVATGHARAASVFSKFSQKHDRRSEQRIAKLQQEDSSRWVRCSTLNCSQEQMDQCKKLKNMDFSSPGIFLSTKRDNTEKGEGDDNGYPESPLYDEFKDAIRDSEYEIDSKGILLATDREGNTFPIANFIARTTEEVCKNDGSTSEKIFRIDGILAPGEKLKQLEIPVEEFPSMSWPMSRWGIQAIIYPGSRCKELTRHAIQVFSGQAQKTEVFTHLGWHRQLDGNWGYLHGTGAIGAPLQNVLNNQIAGYTMPSICSDPLAAAAVSRDFLQLAPRRVTIPLLAIAYLAPLGHALKSVNIEPKFILWLSGGTGCRKTSLSLVLMSHFGNFSGGNPPASFKDTINALEIKGFIAKDSLLLVDDYHPAPSLAEASKMEDKAQQLLRMYGDRIGKSRMTSNIQLQREYPPRCLVLVTGEDVPSGHSTTARFLGLELNQNEVDLPLLQQYQNSPHLLGEAMSGYISWLQPQMDTLPDKLNTLFTKYRKKLLQDGMHGRLSDGGSYLLLGYNYMLKYFYHIGLIDKEEKSDMLAEGRKIIKDILKSQVKIVNKAKPEDIFVNTMLDLIFTQKVSIIDLDNAPVRFPQPLGWEDSDHYYLLPHETYKAIHEVLKGENDPLHMSAKKMWNALYNSGYIDVEREGDSIRHLFKKTVPSGQGSNERIRLLHIRKDAIAHLSKIYS